MITKNHKYQTGIKQIQDNVVKLTKEPWNTEETDMQELRHAGFSNVCILNIAHVTGYYTYVTRLAYSLDVELEGFRKENVNDITN